MISELMVVDEWAAQRVGSGQETPWDWYQLMKLREAIAALVVSDETSLRFTAEVPHLRVVAPPPPVRSKP